MVGRQRVIFLCALAGCFTLAACDEFGGLRARVHPASPASIDDDCLQASLRATLGSQQLTRDGGDGRWLIARAPLEERPGRAVDLYVSSKAADRGALLEVQWTWANFTPTTPKFGHRISALIGTTIGNVMKRCAAGTAYQIRCQLDMPEKYVVPCPHVPPDAAP